MAQGGIRNITRIVDLDDYPGGLPLATASAPGGISAVDRRHLDVLGSRVYLPSTYGVKFDGIQRADGKIIAGQNTLIADQAGAQTVFTLADIGKTIAINGAGANIAVPLSNSTTLQVPGTLVTTITGVSADRVTLAANAANTTNGIVYCTFSWGTDDSAAWASLWDQIATDFAGNEWVSSSARHAIVECPAGISLIAAAPTVRSNGAKCVFWLRPYELVGAGTPQGNPIIEIRGKTGMNTGQWGLAGHQPGRVGTILFFTATGSTSHADGVANNPSCIANAPWTDGVTPTTLALRIDNVTVRQVLPCTMNGVDWGSGGNLRVGDYVADVMSSYRLYDYPPKPIFGAGLVFPKVGSNATNYADHLTVYQHYSGIEVANQSHFNHLYVETCFNGIALNGHSTGIAVGGYCLIQNVPRVIANNDGQGGSIDLAVVYIERQRHAGGGDPTDWRIETEEIYDPSNLITGKILVSIFPNGGPLNRNGGSRLIQHTPTAPMLQQYYGSELRGAIDATYPVIAKTGYDANEGGDFLDLYSAGNDSFNSFAKLRLRQNGGGHLKYGSLAIDYGAGLKLWNPNANGGLGADAGFAYWSSYDGYFYTAYGSGDDQIQKWSIHHDHLNANGYKISSVADPVADQDAATKAWVLKNTIRFPAVSLGVLSGSVDFDASAGSLFFVTLSDESTINAPSNPPSANHSQRLTLGIYFQDSAWPLSWDPVFNFLGATPASPSVGNLTVYYWFIYNPYTMTWDYQNSLAQSA